MRISAFQALVLCDPGYQGRRASRLPLAFISRAFGALVALSKAANEQLVMAKPFKNLKQNASNGPGRDLHHCIRGQFALSRIACYSSLRFFACESGGIGRRARLRIWYRKVWGFESPLSHH